MPAEMATESCADCGQLIAGGRAGCRRLFEEVIAREFSDYRYARRHRLTVDVYALQHPDAYMRSSKSFAAHLTGVCLALEFENAAVLNSIVQRWLSGPRELTKPARLPGGKNSLTIAHVHSAQTPEEHLARIAEWAAVVWSAWSDFHPLARAWVDDAVEARKVRRR